MDREQEILRKLEKVRNLPTLPVVIEKLREAIRDPSSDAHRIAMIIEDDPSMMARILKVVNSPLYGGRDQITSLQLAVARMGFNAVSNIAMSTSVFSTFPKSGQTDFSRELFWKHCICTGIAMLVLFERTKAKLNKRYSSDLLQLAGLLHTIGIIVLEQYFHDDFIRSIDLAHSAGMPLIDAQQEILGADYTLVGSWLGMRWNLSQELLQVIRWHHDPESSDVEYRDICMLCHCANYICNLKKLGDCGDTTAPSLQQKIWLKIGLTVKDISDTVDHIVEESRNSEVLMAFLG